MLPACVSYRGRRDRDDANSWLWVPVYPGWEASCARHLLWDAYCFHRPWYFHPVLRAMINALDLSIFLGGLSNKDELKYLISVIESVDWKTILVVNNRRPKACRRLLSHSPGQLEVVRDSVKYDPQSCRVFVTELCSNCQARFSVHTSSSKLESVVSAPSSVRSWRFWLLIRSRTRWFMFRIVLLEL